MLVQIAVDNLSVVPLGGGRLRARQEIFWLNISALTANNVVVVSDTFCIDRAHPGAWLVQLMLLDVTMHVIALAFR